MRPRVKFFVGLTVVIFLLFVLSWLFLFFLDYGQGRPVSWGVTFSDKYAGELGLDWRQTYLAILDDLGVTQLRLIAYWDEVEKTPDVFTFVDLDWQIAQASKRDRQIILTIGRRAPRWPECHDPAWLEQLAPAVIQDQQLDYLKRVVERYKNNPAIVAWQVENEPLFSWFGRCPAPDRLLLQNEVAAVRAIDQRPVIITDSGELSHWQTAAGITDVLGITLYRIVWNEYFGFWDYWFVPPAAYRLKADLTKIFHPSLTDVIVTELQMEPWTFNRPLIDLTSAERERSFSLKRFRDNIAYVRRAGFSRTYLWGVEYWYWLKEQGDSTIWNEARLLWQR